MIDRRASDRQAERDVDARQRLPCAGHRIDVEAEKLDRHMSLVVIHRDHRVILARLQFHKHRIARHRSGHLEIRRRVGRDYGLGDVDVLASEDAAFSRVRIERGDRDPRVRNSERAERVDRQRDDRGAISVNGAAVQFRAPRDAAREGIVCMFQELSLMPHLSVGDNIVLGRPTAHFGLITRAAYASARAALDRVSAGAIALSARVSELSLAERQLVEIAKAIYRAPKLLILDEATSALTGELVQRVFGVVRELRARGAAILFISHRLHEVEAIADRVSVFRNGRHVETFDAGARSPEAIVRLMIGQSLGELFPPRPTPVGTAQPCLVVRGLTWGRELSGVDLEARRGEIVGLGGLDGQGQREFMHAMFGVLRKVAGTVTLDGRSIAGLDPARAKAPGVRLALAPEDRKSEGLILEMPIATNLRLAALSRRPLGLLRVRDASEAAIATVIERLNLVYRKLSDPVATLSGGNQQKVVLAKWLALSPRCLLLMDPTRGIDVRTKAEIYKLLRELAAEGLTIVMQSTDYEELVHLCDRVYVFYRGQVRRELSGATLGAEALIAASMDLPHADQGAA